ncbi:MAG: sensor histidine kinase [Thermoanaerobaculia bacterium]
MSRRTLQPGPRRHLLLSAAASFLLLTVVALAAIALRVNHTTSGFMILVAILFIASRQPLAVATLSSLWATLLYNVLFFPPKWTLSIDDPENWIALITFLVTSLLANRLLVRARREAERAERSRAEVEALYAMSLDLLRGDGMEGVGRATTRYLEEIGAASGGIILFGASAQQQQILAWSGAPVSDEVEEIVAGTGRHGRITDIPSRFGTDLCLPLTIGGRIGAALFVRGAAAARSALESAANLLSFAIDREHFVEERARVAALRESDALKTSLLQTVSHDLKSPLTVLSVESEALERRGQLPVNAAAHVRAIRDEVSRLHRRIENLLSLARFDAGAVVPRKEPTPAADLFHAARESLPTVTSVRTIRTSVAEETRDLDVDPSLAVEIVINLIENAHRASPPHEAVELSARPSLERENRVWIEVQDRGPGLSEERQRAVRRIEPPDALAGGLGIDLARRLAVLSGGSVEWFAREGGGTVARVDLPAAAAGVQT